MNEEVTIVQKEGAGLSPLTGPLLSPRWKKDAVKGKQNKKLFSGSGKRVHYTSNTKPVKNRRRKFLPRRSQVKQKR